MDNNTWKILPEGFLERIQQIIPKDKQNDVLESFCKDKPISFRTNTLKISSSDLLKELQERGIQCTAVSWYTDAFLLEQTQTKESLTRTDLYKEGMLYIQSLSSMIPALVLNPQQNDLICDLTAAPGSKTTQIAMMMKNSGKIIANDISRNRNFKLKANLAHLGVTNAEVISIPGQSLWKKYPEYFDKTLVDVPCTMEGRFSSNDPKSYRDWTPKKIKILSQLQKFLLRSAISATKPGGLIIYSTCTLEPDENEGVINWILDKEKGKVVVEEINLPIPDKYSGITQWKNKQFDPQIKKTVRILPSQIMEGFYIAALRKTSSTLTESVLGHH